MLSPQRSDLPLLKAQARQSYVVQVESTPGVTAEEKQAIAATAVRMARSLLYCGCVPCLRSASELLSA